MPKALNNQLDLSQFKLIVGLGNVGKDYVRSRHNAGFLFADYLRESLLEEPKYSTWKTDSKLEADIATATGKPVLAKPTTMMNLSGRAVQKIMQYYKIQPNEVLVAFDDMDIDLGNYKLQFEKGPKVHNGLNSIYQSLGTLSLWHLRIGIESREIRGNKLISGQAFALANFAPAELELLRKVFETIY